MIITIPENVVDAKASPRDILLTISNGLKTGFSVFIWVHFYTVCVTCLRTR